MTQVRLKLPLGCGFLAGAFVEAHADSWVGRKEPWGQRTVKGWHLVKISSPSVHTLVRTSPEADTRVGRGMTSRG